MLAATVIAACEVSKERTKADEQNEHWAERVGKQLPKPYLVIERSKRTSKHWNRSIEGQFIRNMQQERVEQNLIQSIMRGRRADLGCWAVPLTPASPTTPMANPAARPDNPTARPAPRCKNPTGRKRAIELRHKWSFSFVKISSVILFPFHTETNDDTTSRSYVVMHGATTSLPIWS